MVDFLLNFGLISTLFQDINRCFFFFAEIPQKVDNIHRANVLRILPFPPFTFGRKFCFSFAFG